MEREGLVERLTKRSAYTLSQPLSVSVSAAASLSLSLAHDTAATQSQPELDQDPDELTQTAAYSSSTPVSMVCTRARLFMPTMCSLFLRVFEREA